MTAKDDFTRIATWSEDVEKGSEKNAVELERQRASLAAIDARVKALEDGEPAPPPPPPTTPPLPTGTVSSASTTRTQTQTQSVTVTQPVPLPPHELPLGGIVAHSATGGGDGSASKPYTFAQAGRRERRGLRYECLPGDYPDEDAHTLPPDHFSGTEAEPIEFRASQGPVVIRRRPESIKGAHVRLVGNFIRDCSRDGAAWFKLADSRAIHLDGWTFQGSDRKEKATYSSLYALRCEEILVRNCRMKEWWGNKGTKLHQGDLLRFDLCRRVVVTDCDLTRAYAGHATVAMHDSDQCALRRNRFSNAWDRVINFQRDDQSNLNALFGTLVEENEFFDSNDPSRSPVLPTSQRGAGQTARPSGYRTIFRNNRLFNNHEGIPEGTQGIVMLSGYSKSTVNHRIGIYQNTIDNPGARAHGIALVSVGDDPHIWTENVIIDNRIVVPDGIMPVKLATFHQGSWPSMRIEGNGGPYVHHDDVQSAGVGFVKSVNPWIFQAGFTCCGYEVPGDIVHIRNGGAGVTTRVLGVDANDRLLRLETVPAAASSGWTIDLEGPDGETGAWS